ncbi:MAG: RnfABCDGE type electron transport complex subunit B [Verrucomicrobia bacterium]|nr:RnfABCDGE type electron transport complex subunit B [Verrucomicrobiota bacterium]
MSADIINSTIIMGGIGLFCSVLLGVAARFFAVHEHPRIEALTALLPGVNCGSCGLPGCSEYARALILHGAKVNLCKPGGPETMRQIAVFLGVESVAMERQVAMVLCGGDDKTATRKFRYNGIADCAAAALVGGGDKACGYGCLGLGSCARICPTDAIEITRARLAIVHPELCIGCGQCMNACPKKIIRLVPESRTIHVLCRSKERGIVVKKNCSVGCIACTLCTKVAGNAIKMEGTLAVVDYSQGLENAEAITKCPQHTIIKRSGRKEVPA